LPELAKLGGFLLEVKHRMALDRDLDNEWDGITVRGLPKSPDSAAST